MKEPRFYVAGDYAGLEFRDGEFYYGYERSICMKCGNMNKRGSEHCEDCEDAGGEWCFYAKFNEEVIYIPFSKLGTKDMFDVVSCLNMGIGWVLAKYKLVLST